MLVRMAICANRPSGFPVKMLDMDGFTPIIIIEGFLGFGVVLLLYWMHRREMKAIAKRKAEAAPPMNPLVATRDAAKARVEEARAAILAKLEEEARLTAHPPVDPPASPPGEPPAAAPGAESQVGAAVDAPESPAPPTPQDTDTPNATSPEGRIQS
ncbi:MAG: hypothetical protein RIR28_561 [Pseudomonadota bacterium]